MPGSRHPRISHRAGHYWKPGHGYVACPRTPAAKRRASKAVKAACRASFQGLGNVEHVRGNVYRVNDAPSSERTIFWVRDEPYPTAPEAVSAARKLARKSRARSVCVFSQRMSISGDFTKMHKRKRVKCITKSK